MDNEKLLKKYRVLLLRQGPGVTGFCFDPYAQSRAKQIRETEKEVLERMNSSYQSITADHK